MHMEEDLIVADKCEYCYNFEYRLTNLGTFDDTVPSDSGGQSSEQTVPSQQQPPAPVEKVVAPTVTITATTCCRFARFGLVVALEAAKAFGQKVCLPLSGESLIIEGPKATVDIEDDPVMKHQDSVENEESSDVSLHKGTDVRLYPGSTLQVLATAASTSRHAAGVDASLADLLEGTLLVSTLEKLYGRRERSIASIWFCDPRRQFPENAPSKTATESLPNKDALVQVFRALEKEPIDVIVKVSSSAVHTPSLVDLNTAFTALSKVRDNKSLRKQMSKVVVAIFKLPLGCVTIMRDLRKEGYKVLQVSRLVLEGDEWKKSPLFRMDCLWKGVLEEVKRELLPLGQLNIVHCDIRPGYDVTSNILVKEYKGTVDLVLIDHESLVDFNDLPLTFGPDGRFLPRRFADDAVGYLWWQCLSLAFVWANKIYQAELLNAEGRLALALSTLSLNAAKWPRSDHSNDEVKVDSEGREFVNVNFESWLLSDTKIRHIIRSTDHVYVQANDVNDLLQRVALFFEGKAIQYLKLDKTRGNDEDKK